MRKCGLESKVRRKYEVTTNSAHHLLVANNIPNQRFEATVPKQKPGSDVTYLQTRGGLYIAAIMDLCGHGMITGT